MDSSPPPPPDPVVLTWSQDPPPEETPQIPFGAPPSYNSVRLPDVPVTYTFSRLSSDSMLLLPPPDLPDSRPLYYISVNTNLFNPLSAYTTICRGGNKNGEFVAEFQSAMPGKRVSVFLGRKELPIPDVLKDLKPYSSKHRKCLWLWAGPKHQFKWDCLNKPYICHSSRDGKEIYAKFSPTRPRGTRSDVYTLELRPSGHGMIDDILVSALLIEQKRLMEPSIP